MLSTDPDRADRDRGRARPRQPRAARDRARGPGRRRGARSRAPRQARGARRSCWRARGGTPGVVGIVASRLAERHWRPAVLIALDGAVAGGARGAASPGSTCSPRSSACSEHLGRFGGHRAAAGLEIEADRLDAFREAFLARAAAALDPGGLRAHGDGRRRRRGRTATGIGRWPSSWSAWRPFGMGNPGIRGCWSPRRGSRDVRPMGEEGTHAGSARERRSGRATGGGVRGERRRSPGALDGAPSISPCELELNRWNGAVQPRVVVREASTPSPARAARPGAELLRRGDAAPDGEWWSAMEPSSGAPLADWPAPWPVSAREGREHRRAGRSPRGGRGGRDRRARLQRAPVLALSAPTPSRRRSSPSRPPTRAASAAAPRVGRLLPLRRRRAVERGAEPVAPAARAWRSPTGRRWRASPDARPRASSTSCSSIRRRSPTSTSLAAGARHGVPAPRLGAGSGSRSERCPAAEWEPAAPRPPRSGAALRDAGREAAGGEDLRALLGRRRAGYPRTPEVAGAMRARPRGARARSSGGREAAALALRVVSSEETELERSRAYPACRGAPSRRATAFLEGETTIE